MEKILLKGNCVVKIIFILCESLNPVPNTFNLVWNTSNVKNIDARTKKTKTLTVTIS